MKSTTYQKLKNKLLILLPVLLIISSLESCVKTDESTLNLSALSVIHASPDLPAIDFYFNGDRINGNRIISYNDTIPYKIFNSGTAAIIVKKYISSTTYISTNIELENEKNYSFFVAGKANETSYLLIQDDLTAPNSGKAKIRFINLSPDAPSLNFQLNANTLFGTIAFKTYSDFTSIDPGDCIISISNAANGTSLSEQNLNIEAGKIYTVWANGLINTSETGHSISMKVITFQPS